MSLDDASAMCCMAGCDALSWAMTALHDPAKDAVRRYPAAIGAMLVGAVVIVAGGLVAQIVKQLDASPQS